MARSFLMRGVLGGIEVYSLVGENAPAVLPHSDMLVHLLRPVVMKVAQFEGLDSFGPRVGWSWDATREEADATSLRAEGLGAIGKSSAGVSNRP